MDSKRVVFVGFGPFARRMYSVLDGQASEIIIIGEDNHYLDRFKGTGIRVFPLKGDVDSDSIDEALVNMGIVTEEALKQNGNGNRKKTVDIAIVDLEDLGEVMNVRALKSLRGFAECIVVSTRHEKEVSVLEELGAHIAVCPEAEVADTVLLRLYNDHIRDMVTVIEYGDVREAYCDVPDDWTGKSFADIEKEYGIKILFVIRSYPSFEKKKVLGHREEVIYPGDIETDDDVASKSVEVSEDGVTRFSNKDTKVRVMGSFKWIKKLPK